MKHSQWRQFILLVCTVLGFILYTQPAAGAQSNDQLFVLIGDSLMKAKEGNQAAVAKNIEQFEAEWESIKQSKNTNATKVDQKLKAIQKLLAKENQNQAELSKSLATLSSVVVQYDQEQNPQDQQQQKQEVKKLIPLIQNMNNAIEKGNYGALNSQYKSILNQWNSSEKIVHDESIAAYGNIEKYMALIRIAISQNPMDLEKANQNLGKLTDVVENFLAGKAPKWVKGEYTLEDLANLLGNAKKQISQQEYIKASEELNELLTIWPMVEGDVQTRDPNLYSDIETKIPAAMGILNSKKVDENKAKVIIDGLNSRLTPLLSKTSYSMWDAALILLREGFEALLIIAALMAFLKKMGQEKKQKWIWTGVAAGILASAALSLVINLVFTQIAAAASREYIEGITGIIAVLMMLTVGIWLHNKSNIGNWNKFINQQMEQAIARGSLVSFSLISFLSIFREGAETIIFYTGMAPYIGLQQLLLGIVLAVAIIVIIGFVIIKYTVKVPIRLFFRVATILIYLLAFKILGISIHALQVSNVLSNHTVEYFPHIDWIGIYPTWETMLTQILLLIIISTIIFIVRQKNSHQVVKM